MVATGSPTSKWIAGLDPEMSFSNALELILRQRSEGVFHFVPLATERAQEDTEYVHGLRVACRRLTAVLKTLGDGIPGKARKPLAKLLKRLRRDCGKARDLDVHLSFLENLLPHLDPEATPGVGVIREQLFRRRRKAQKKLRRRLEQVSDKLTRAESKLFHFLPEPAPAEEESQNEKFSAVCIRMLSDQLKELWDRASDESLQPETLHQLRIACKNLRYAAEVSAPVLHESFREEFYPQLQRIQDLLGTWNDALVADEELDKLKKKWKRRCDKQGQCKLPGSGRIAWRELEIGFAAVQAAYRRKGEQALREFRQLWPDFTDRGFRRPVEELLAAAEERHSRPPEGNGKPVTATHSASPQR